MRRGTSLRSVGSVAALQRALSANVYHAHACTCDVIGHGQSHWGSTLTLRRGIPASVSVSCSRGYASIGDCTKTEDDYWRRGERYTVIPLVNATGILDYIIVKGTTDAEVMLDFAKTVLVRVDRAPCTAKSF